VSTARGNSMCARVDVVCPAGAARLFPPPANVVRPAGRRSLDRWPTSIDNDLAAPDEAPTADSLASRRPSVRIPPARARRPSAPFPIRRRLAESATSGLHSPARSLIQSRLDFSPASVVQGPARRLALYSTQYAHHASRRSAVCLLGGLSAVVSNALLCCASLTRQIV